MSYKHEQCRRSVVAVTVGEPGSCEVEVVHILYVPVSSRPLLP